MRRLCRLAFRRAATAVVMAKFNRIDPIFLGVRDVRVIPHTIDDDCVNEFVDRNGSPRILYVGHMAPQRGTDALIRAFADIAVDHPDATLHLVGRCVRPFTEDRLEELVARSGVGNRITISGELSGDDKRRAFGQADLFVFPTVHPTESFGLVLIEAMMWSLPIVATNWRGNSDVLGPRFGGACFDIGSAGLAPSLVATLRHVLAHDELFGAWGKLNREVFDQRYNKARVPADLVRLIVGMATERHATRGSPPP